MMRMRMMMSTPVFATDAPNVPDVMMRVDVVKERSSQSWVLIRSGRRTTFDWLNWTAGGNKQESVDTNTWCITLLMNQMNLLLLLLLLELKRMGELTEQISPSTTASTKERMEKDRGETPPAPSLVKGGWRWCERKRDDVMWFLSLKFPLSFRSNLLYPHLLFWSPWCPMSIRISRVYSWFCSIPLFLPLLLF